MTQMTLYGKKIWIYRESINFRLGIDGLSNFIISNKVNHNPQEGIYLFYNKYKDRIKCLSWHKNGFAMIYKKIEEGKFYLNFKKEQGIIEIDDQEFNWLLTGLDWQTMRHWGELRYSKFG